AFPTLPDNSSGRTSPPNVAAPADKNIAQPGSDLSITDAAEVGQRRIPQARSAPTPEVPGAPTDATANPPDAASNDQAIARQVYQSRDTNVPVAQGTQEQFDLAGSQMNGVGSQS